MIIWSGLGFLVAVIVFILLLTAEYVVESVFQDETYYQAHGWPKLLAFFLAAAVVWPLGIYLIPLLVGALLANAADSDFLFVFALQSKAWHRGFSHSLVFALIVWALPALLLGKQRLKEILAYGLAFASHGLLDYLTSRKGAGVQLLWPFPTARLKLGWWGLLSLPIANCRLSIVRLDTANWKSEIENRQC